MRKIAQGLSFIILVAFLAGAFVLTPFASAEGDAVLPSDSPDQLIAECMVSPSTSVFSQELKISIDISNMGNKRVRALVVTRGETVVDTADELAQGDHMTIMDEALATKEEQAAGKIIYTLTYRVDMGDGRLIERSQLAQATLPQKKNTPELEFTRTLSSTHVKKNSEVTVTYRVRNTGDVALYGLTLTDELCGSVGDIYCLEPGNRESFVKKVQVKETSVSRPSIIYTSSAPDGEEEEVNIQLKAVTVYLADEQLDRQLTADKTSVAPGELVTLRLSLYNGGNVTYNDLQISDPSLGELGSIPGGLKPGEEYTFVKTVSLKTTTTFQFDIAGRSGNGNEIVESSNMLTVSVSPVIEDILVKVSAAARPPYLAAPGETLFVITLENSGEVDIRNAVLCEQTLGELKNLAVLAPGVTTIEYPLIVDADTTYVFMVQLTGAREGHLTVIADPVTVSVDENGGQRALMTEKPTDRADISQMMGIPQRLDPMKYYEQMILWASLVVSVLVLIVLYAFTRRRGKRRRRRRLSRGSQDSLNNTDNPDFANTRPHAPVNGKKQE